MVHHRYTPEDDDLIRKYHNLDYSCGAIGRLLNPQRPHGSVNMRINKLGLPPRQGNNRGRPAKAALEQELLKPPKREDITIKLYFDDFQRKFIPISLPRIRFLERPLEA